MNAWLLKTEPEVFSLADMQREGQSSWDGVRNYAARNFLSAVSPGDPCFIYHSNAAPSGIAGLAQVIASASPDLTARDPNSDYFDPKDVGPEPRWSLVRVSYVATAKRFLPLAWMRGQQELSGMMLFTRARLSVMSVSSSEFLYICEAAGLHWPIPEAKQP